MRGRSEFYGTAARIIQDCGGDHTGLRTQRRSQTAYGGRKAACKRQRLARTPKVCLGALRGLPQAARLARCACPASRVGAPWCAVRPICSASEIPGGGEAVRVESLCGVVGDSCCETVRLRAVLVRFF